MRTVIIAGVVILLLVAGGGYWYFVVYQQKQFAKQIIFLYEDTVAEVFRAETPAMPVRDDDDYPAARAGLAARKEYFEKAKRELARLKLPVFGEGEETRKEFSKFVDGELAIITDIERDLDFFEEAVKLRDTLSRQPAYRGSGAEAIYVLPHLAGNMTGVRDTAKKLFGGEDVKFWARPIDVNPREKAPLWASAEVSYAGLKSAWQKLEPYIEEMLKDLAPAQSQELMAPEERKLSWPDSVSRKDVNSRFIPFAEKNAKEKLDRFYDLLRFAIGRNSAKDAIRERYYVNATEEDVERRRAFLERIDLLRKAYGK